MDVVDFIRKELEGFSEQLRIGTKPPYSSGKSHSYSADEKKMVCSKCNFDRTGFKAVPKSAQREIMQRVDQLNTIIDQVKQEAAKS